MSKNKCNLKESLALNSCISKTYCEARQRLATFGAGLPLVTPCEAVKTVIMKALNGTRELDYHMLLTGVCYTGNLDLVKFVVNQVGNRLTRTDFNSSLSEACHDGYIDIVHFMIEKGANNWPSGLYMSCLGGELALVKLMVEKAKGVFTKKRWNLALYGACSSGVLEVVEFLVECIGKYSAQIWGYSDENENEDETHTWFDWDEGLTGACKGKNNPLAKGRDHAKIACLMVENGADTCYNCEKPALNHTHPYIFNQ